MFVFNYFFDLNPNLDCRSVTQSLLSSASTLRCSCCPRRSCGCLTAPWVLVKGLMRLSQKVRPCSHPKAQSLHCNRLKIMHVTAAALFLLRLNNLRPRDGGSSPEPGRVLLLQYRESFPLHWGRWLRPQVQPHQQGVRLPGGRSIPSVQIQNPGRMQ